MALTIRRPVATAVMLLALLAGGVVTLFDLTPPAPRPADAPSTEFSAERAYAHVERTAARTHVAGSSANDDTRAYVRQVLDGLGLRTEIQDTVGGAATRPDSEDGELARVQNVIGVLPGTQSTGRVFLVAHYDSVQVGPGGNDDSSGVAAVLETARALAAGPKPRNDIVFVLTDAEEACLCGATAFVDYHPLAADGGVVLNLEARGSTGPVIMFETSPDNAKLVSVFGSAAPHPLGTSFAVEIYRLLPNDTDFTPFLEAGRFGGLNAAYIDGAAVYHRPQDTPASMNRASLQHHGDNALALARAFGDLDLSTVDASGDATYFPVPGFLVRYPGFLVWPLAGLGLLGVLVLAYVTRRSGATTWGRLAGGFGLGLLPILVAPVAAQVLWLGITAVRPEYGAVLDPFQPLYFRLAVLTLTLAVLLGWYGLCRRRIGAPALAIGGLVWLGLLGIGLAALVPGGSYLASLPALGGAIAGLVALRWRGWGGLVAVTLGMLVGVVVLLPAVVLLLPALGLAMGGAGAFLATLLGLSLLPAVEALYPADPAEATQRRRLRTATPGLATVVVALLLSGVGLVVDRFDAAHPSATSLMYFLDASTGQARWVSRETSPSAWTSHYVREQTELFDEYPVLVARGDRLYTGPAEVATLQPPAVVEESDSGAGPQRTVRLRIVPTPDTRFIGFSIAAPASAIQRVVVGSREIPGNRVDPGPWGFALVVHAPPSEGVPVELTLGETPDQVLIRVYGASTGLDALPGFVARPEGVGVSGSHSSDLVVVARTYPV